MFFPPRLVSLRIEHMATGAAIGVAPVAIFVGSKVAGELGQPAKGAHLLAGRGLAIEHLLLLAPRARGTRQREDTPESQGLGSRQNGRALLGIACSGGGLIAGNTVGGVVLAGIKGASRTTFGTLGPHRSGLLA